MTINEVVDVLTMRYYLVPTPWSVFMPCLMACAMMIGCTPFGVVGADFYHMLLNKRWIGVPRRMVQMSIVNVIDMTFMFDRGVATLWSVLMTVVRMSSRIFHKTNNKTNKSVFNQVQSP